MNIVCQNCRKDSGIFKTERNGIDAAQAQNAGFIVKCLFLYGIDEWLFVCGKDCYKILIEKKFAEHGVSEETIAEVKEMLAEQKATIPAMAQEACNFMSKVQKILTGKTNGKSHTQRKNR